MQCLPILGQGGRSVERPGLEPEFENMPGLFSGHAAIWQMITAKQDLARRVHLSMRGMPSGCILGGK